MATILAEFLSANLLPIGEDDEKLQLLEEAALELASEISAKPLLAYRFALVGLDERVLATDPVHRKAAAAIASKWQTMTNKTGADPVQVYRAVLLRSIEVSAKAKPAIQFAVMLTARTLTGAASGDQAAVAIRSMLSRWEKDAAAEITEAWVSPVDLALPKLSVKVKKPQINKEELYLAIARAVGPTEKDSKSLVSPNPHWPNTGQPWSQEFTGRAAEAVQGAVQAAAKIAAEDLQEALRETVHGLSGAIERLAIRDAKSELLWLRVSSFSPSARRGYAELGALELVFHAALDVSRVVARRAPQSVDYFLSHLVGEFSDKRVKLADALADLGPRFRNCPEGQSIIETEKLPPQGRRSWLDYALRASLSGSFEDQLGVKKNHEIDHRELAVSIYEELQIRKLLIA